MPKTIPDGLLERFPDRENPAYRRLEQQLGTLVPKFTYRQMSAPKLVRRVVPQTGPLRILDLGCGAGKTREEFLQHNPDITWKGVEIEATYHEKERGAQEHISIYDGVNLPFDDASFDYVFTSQVFEHVERPAPLLTDVRRVLKPGATFFGSLSGGEPYHWFSLFNYTALGWKQMLDDAGLKPFRMFAGIDALTLLLHHWSPNRELLGNYFGESILNARLNAEDPTDEAAIVYQNTLKLAFAGHIFFIARKPGQNQA